MIHVCEYFPRSPWILLSNSDWISIDQPFCKSKINSEMAYKFVDFMFNNDGRRTSFFDIG